MRGLFHLRVHVIISMVPDVKFETASDWSNNIWGQNKMALGSHANPRDGSSLHCESHNQANPRVTPRPKPLCAALYIFQLVQWTMFNIQCSTEWFCLLNIPWGRVHTDNYMVELPHVTKSTDACETVTYSRDIFYGHRKIICGCKWMLDRLRLWSQVNLKSLKSWTFVHFQNVRSFYWLN